MWKDKIRSRETRGRAIEISVFVVELKQWEQREVKGFEKYLEVN